MGRKACCRFCREYALRKRVLESGTLMQARRMVKYFSNLYIEVDADLGYTNAILDGSWPSAEGMLLVALEKARKHQAEATP